MSRSQLSVVQTMRQGRVNIYHMLFRDAECVESSHSRRSPVYQLSHS